ncbi:MAG: hypothetical protein HY296_01150 [Thaumarchaeota archaeon]|nr:hypothetical protein [Nitrososphaerota archaeon]
MQVVRTVEGRTTLAVPRASLERKVPPTAPVFFNPAASTNRDVTVALTQASEGKSFCDAMAGVGARGVRVANEVTRGMSVTMVDLNGGSLRLARSSARINGVGGRCSFSKGDASVFLHSVGGKDARFDFVDVDPFGSPARFIQPLLNAVADGGIASVTATDTAVLCGVHPETSRRRYGSVPLNNEFHHETGVRILMDACRRQAAVLDLGISPVAAHSTRHYIRAYFRVLVGASSAEASSRNEGFVVACGECGERSVRRERVATCPSCGKKAKCAGPLWTGRLTEKKTVEKAARVALKLGFSEAEKVLSALPPADPMPPWSFSLERVCSGLGVPSVQFSEVEDRLRANGFGAARQPFELLGLKTDAGYAEVVAAVRDAARNR